MTNKPTDTDQRGEREAQKRQLDDKVDMQHDENGNLILDDEYKPTSEHGADQSQQTGRDAGISQGERQTDGGGAKP